MALAELSPEEAYREATERATPILDLRTRSERRRFGYPPGSVKVSLLIHALRPRSGAIYLCQHAVRSRLPASRGARQIAGGFVAWERAGLPIERDAP